MKRTLLRLVGTVSIAVVMVLALIAVNLNTVSLAEAGGKPKAEKDKGYDEKEGTSLFWD